MVILLMEIAFAATAFGVMWGPLGGGKLVRELLRNEEAELRVALADVETKLAEVAADPDPDETTAMLKEHYEGEAEALRRKLERL